MKHKNGTESAIQARLRELTEEIRRLRAELSDDSPRQTPNRERTIAHLREKLKKPSKPEE